MRLKWLQPTCHFGDRTEVYTTKTSFTDSAKPHLKYFEKAFIYQVMVAGYVIPLLYTIKRKNIYYMAGLK